MTGNKRKLATTAKEPAAKKAAIENKGKTSGKKKPFQKSNQSTVKKELEVNGSEATTKTADGSRRLQKKQLLQERRGLHPFSSKLEQIKRKWEVLRASQTSKQDREKLVQEILDIIGKDMQQVYFFSPSFDETRDEIDFLEARWFKNHSIFAEIGNSTTTRSCSRTMHPLRGFSVKI